MAALVFWLPSPAHGDSVEAFTVVYETLQDLGLIKQFVYDPAEVSSIIDRTINDDIGVSHGVVLEYCFERAVDDDSPLSRGTAFAMQTSLSIMIYHWARRVHMDEVTPMSVALDRLITQQAVTMMRENGTYRSFASAHACLLLARSATGLPI